MSWKMESDDGGDSMGITLGEWENLLQTIIQAVVKEPFGDPNWTKKIWRSEQKQGFSGFSQERERGNMKRIIEVETEIRIAKETLAVVLKKQDQLIMENEKWRKKCNGYQSTIKINYEIKKTVANLKKEALEIVRETLEKVEGVVRKGILEELRNDWKKESEYQRKVDIRNKLQGNRQTANITQNK